jgi:hypothetical protein
MLLGLSLVIIASLDSLEMIPLILIHPKYNAHYFPVPWAQNEVGTFAICRLVQGQDQDVQESLVFLDHGLQFFGVSSLCSIHRINWLVSCKDVFDHIS